MGRFATLATTNLLAINWEPEIRGVLIVVIAISLFCGSIYLLLATNLGARLGFLVALTGLMGWLMLMGIMWSIYGIGLKGPDPSWKAMPGRTVLQDTGALYQAGVFNQRVNVPGDATFPEEADVVADEFQREGWTLVPEDDQSFAQAAAAAGVFLEDSGAFAAGEYQAQRVFDRGGKRYPMIGDFDLLAFFHEPRHAVVEVAPLVPVRAEPGRAPPPATVDDSRQRQYVYMVRNLGARRQPAFVLTVGAGLIFFVGCWLLHRRDRVVVANQRGGGEVVPVGTP